jgi:hypothetical protein
LDEMFKKISESSENDREQLAHTCLEIWIYESRSTWKTKVFVLLCHPLWLIWQCQGMEVQYSVEYRWLKRKAPSPIWLRKWSWTVNTYKWKQSCT